MAWLAVFVCVVFAPDANGRSGVGHKAIGRLTQKPTRKFLGAADSDSPNRVAYGVPRTRNPRAQSFGFQHPPFLRLHEHRPDGCWGDVELAQTSTRQER